MEVIIMEDKNKVIEDEKYTVEESKMEKHEEKQKNKSKKSKKKVVCLIAFLLVVVIGVLSYFLVFKDKKEPVIKNNDSLKISKQLLEEFGFNSPISGYKMLNYDYSKDVKSFYVISKLMDKSKSKIECSELAKDNLDVISVENAKVGDKDIPLYYFDRGYCKEQASYVAYDDVNALYKKMYGENLEKKSYPSSDIDSSNIGAYANLNGYYYNKKAGAFYKMNRDVGYVAKPTIEIYELKSAKEENNKLTIKIKYLNLERSETGEYSLNDNVIWGDSTKTVDEIKKDILESYKEYINTYEVIFTKKGKNYIFKEIKKKDNKLWHKSKDENIESINEIDDYTLNNSKEGKLYNKVAMSYYNHLYMIEKYNHKMIASKMSFEDKFVLVEGQLIKTYMKSDQYDMGSVKHSIKEDDIRKVFEDVYGNDSYIHRDVLYIDYLRDGYQQINKYEIDKMFKFIYDDNTKEYVLDTFVTGITWGGDYLQEFIESAEENDGRMEIYTRAAYIAAPERNENNYSVYPFATHKNKSTMLTTGTSEQSGQYAKNNMEKLSQYKYIFKLDSNGSYHFYSVELVK